MSYVIVSGRATIDKDPDASLIYGIDIADVIADGDAINGVPTVTGSGVTLGTASVAGTVIKARMSAGPVAGTTVGVTFSWATAGGDTDQRTIYLRGVQR